MSESTGYNGWNNYETWLVSLWLNNDQVSYGLLLEAKSQPGNMCDKAEWLKDELASSGLLADLINAAFARVDWAEVLQD